HNRRIAYESDQGHRLARGDRGGGCSVALAELDDALRTRDRVNCLRVDRGEEDLDPGNSVAALADSLERLVVPRAVALQVRTQVEQGCGKPAMLDEQEDGQQTADPPVSV